MVNRLQYVVNQGFPQPLRRSSRWWLAHLLDKRRRSSTASFADLLSGSIELCSPKPSEEAQYTIEVVIRASKDYADKHIMSVVLTVM